MVKLSCRSFVCVAISSRPLIARMRFFLLDDRHILFDIIFDERKVSADLFGFSLSLLSKISLAREKKNASSCYLEQWPVI